MNAITQLDQQLFLLLNFDGGEVMDRAMWIASNHLFGLPLYVLMVWLLWRKYGWRKMLTAFAMIVVTVVLADQICNLFKFVLLPKLRPTHTPELQGVIHTVGGYIGGRYGTVSAHAATTISIALFSALLLRKWWWSVIVALWVMVVCYSRIYLGVHFPMDILCGVALGSLLGYVEWWIWRKKII
ncbi:MAG: phosphatase PAP2 family protein [Rikenellaceae bacterium]|nr:phosphatase PAP2 family protein [Rikenellaceae bacterium]